MVPRFGIGPDRFVDERGVLGALAFQDSPQLANRPNDFKGSGEVALDGSSRTCGPAKRGTALIRLIATLALLAYAATGVEPPQAPTGTRMRSGEVPEPSYPLRINLGSNETASSSITFTDRARRSSPGNQLAEFGAPQAIPASPDEDPGLQPTTQVAQGQYARSAQTADTKQLGLTPGLEGLRFSIGPTELQRSGALRTRKRFEINGGAPKSLPIRVSDTGSIDLDAKDLLLELQGTAGARALEKLSAARSTDSVSFDELRSAGFDVRYDAVRDRVTINAPRP